MYKFKGIDINKNELIKICNELIKDKRRLIVINGYINENKENVICYSFDINGEVITYKITGEEEIDSITSIYKGGAAWCEEELEELMKIKFKGLNRTGRLFLPEEFKEGEGQILVIPLKELKKFKEK